MRIQFGLKAWSTNVAIIPAAQALYDTGDLDYVEVFCVPGSVDMTSGAWSSSKLPFVVHAPHSISGLNFSLPDMQVINAKLTAESFRMADALGAEYVIFHPGTHGRIDETIRQMMKIRDSRMLVENKPYRGIDDSICVGSRPGEIKALMTALDIGFCLDFGHAIAASNSHGVPAFEFISSLVAMAPSMFHLTDGDILSEIDHHERYGEGNFPLRELLALIPDGERVTNESKRTNPDSLVEYSMDRKKAFELMHGTVK